MLKIADPVADVLGIVASGALPLMSAVAEGLPLGALDRLAATMAPDDGKFVYRLVPRPTLARRRAAAALNAQAGRLSAEEGTRLTRLAAVWAMAMEVWGGQDLARRFMFTPHMLLHGRSPVDLVLESELGRPVVEAILGGLQHGTAV